MVFTATSPLAQCLYYTVIYNAVCKKKNTKPRFKLNKTVLLIRARQLFGGMVGGAGCVRGQEKEWMGCFLDDLRAFGINADQWTTAAQDEGLRKISELDGTHTGEVVLY